MKRALVIGAQPGSLGAAVAELMSEGHDWRVTTAGIRGEEEYLDARYEHSAHFVMQKKDYDAIICTVGRNEESYPGSREWLKILEDDLYLNSVAPMILLDAFIQNLKVRGASRYFRHFVAVSSNSAHIARSTSLGYCASKAALSMSLRCAARKNAGRHDLTIWGVEPGWLEDTPMSESVKRRLSEGVRPHRIPHGRGIEVSTIARQIVHGVTYQGIDMNGCMIRTDGGEQ